MVQSDIINSSADVEISLSGLFRSVFKKLWIVLIAAVLVGAFVFFTTRGDESQAYTTSYKNYFYTESPLIEAKDGSLVSAPCSMSANAIMQLYNYIATNDDILQQIIENSSLDLTADEIKSMISVDLDSSASIVTVTIIGNTSEEAYTVAELLNKFVSEEITAKIECSRIETLVEPSTPVLQVINKNTIKSAVMASLLTIIISIVIIVIIEFAEDKVKTPQQLEERFGIVVLGCIPETKKSLNSKYTRNFK